MSPTALGAAAKTEPGPLDMNPFTLAFRAADVEGEYLGEVAKRRWPVLVFIFAFDVACFCFRFAAKLLGARRSAAASGSAAPDLVRDMAHQLSNMAMLYVVIGLLNKRARKSGNNAARQEEVLLSAVMALAICNLLSSLRPDNASDYVYIGYFLICTCSFLKIRWWLGTALLATPTAMLRAWHGGSGSSAAAAAVANTGMAAGAGGTGAAVGQLLPPDAIVHIVVAWAVGGLLAYVSDWYRRQMFANAKLAAAAHEAELLQARARVSAQRMLAEAQAQAATRALSVAREKAASDAKSEFMSLMCHEVRTPLNGCLASAEMLLETALEEEQRELAETIRVSGAILLSTVSNFLDFFKLEAGKPLDIVRAPVQLRLLVHDVHCIIEAMVGRGGAVALREPDLSGVPQVVHVDPDRLRGILLNLYTNAAKFTRKGDILLRVRQVPAGYTPRPPPGWGSITLRPPLGRPGLAERGPPTSAGGGSGAGAGDGGGADPRNAPANTRRGEGGEPRGTPDAAACSAGSSDGEAGAAACPAAGTATAYGGAGAGDQSGSQGMWAWLLPLRQSCGSSGRQQQALQHRVPAQLGTAGAAAAAGGACSTDAGKTGGAKGGGFHSSSSSPSIFADARQSTVLAAAAPPAPCASLPRAGSSGSEGSSTCGADAGGGGNAASSAASSADTPPAPGACAGTAAAPPGSAANGSVLGSGPDPGWLLFEVSDSGIGIAPDGLAALFREFVQGTDDEMRVPRTRGGTGLGLSICSKQVGMLGGIIGAHSARCQGSTFWFMIPGGPAAGHAAVSGGGGDGGGGTGRASSGGGLWRRRVVVGGAAERGQPAAAATSGLLGRAPEARVGPGQAGATDSLGAEAAAPLLQRPWPPAPQPQLPPQQHPAPGPVTPTPCGSSSSAGGRTSAGGGAPGPGPSSSLPTNAAAAPATAPVAAADLVQRWHGAPDTALMCACTTSCTPGAPPSWNPGSGSSSGISAQCARHNALAAGSSTGRPPLHPPGAAGKAGTASGAGADGPAIAAQQPPQPLQPPTPQPTPTLQQWLPQPQAPPLPPPPPLSVAPSRLSLDRSAPPAPLLDTSLLLGKRVLLVEDNLINQTVARKMLATLGMSVQVAANGLEAVRAVDPAAAAAVAPRSSSDGEGEGGGAGGGTAAPAAPPGSAVDAGRHFDVVLMDMAMPVMGGVEATRAIRAAGHVQLPIVAMTANASERDRQECADCGMDGFLSKPVLRDTLARAILAALQEADGPGRAG